MDLTTQHPARRSRNQNRNRYFTTKEVAKSTKEENVFLRFDALSVIRSSCPSLAAYTVACLAGVSPAAGIGYLPV